MSSYQSPHYAPSKGKYYANETESVYEQAHTSLYRPSTGTLFDRRFKRVEETSSSCRVYSSSYDELPYVHSSSHVYIAPQHSRRSFYPLPPQSIARTQGDREGFKPTIDPDTADAAAALIALPNSVKEKKSRNMSAEIMHTNKSEPRSAFYRVTERDNLCSSSPPEFSPQSVMTDQLAAPTCYRRIRPSSSSDSSVASDMSHDEANVARVGKTSCSYDEEEEDTSSQTSENAWFSGCTSLALPEDDDVLSPLHCFMRKYCVEAFSATEEDVALPRYGRGYGSKIQVGQVGVRCLHCRWRKPHDRAERAVCYPSSIKNIYHSMETWQRRHSIVCDDIPGWVKKRLAELMKLSRSFAGGRRQYWTDAGMKLGLVDTKRGVRFSKDPDSSLLSDGAKSYTHSLLYTPPKKTTPRRALVAEDDRLLVTKYLFLLMEQMQPCHFTEEDRTGGRSKVKDNMDVGFPGLECKHCMGKAGFGRYFPNTLDNLALANSDRNIYNHMIKCRRCPADVKNALRRSHSKRCDEEGSKNRRGSRRKFFERIWNRLHKEGPLLCSLAMDDGQEMS